MLTTNQHCTRCNTKLTFLPGETTLRCYCCWSIETRRNVEGTAQVTRVANLVEEKTETPVSAAPLSTQFALKTTDQECILERYMGQDEKVQVPARVNGRPVTKIGNYRTEEGVLMGAFEGQAHVKNVTLEKGLCQIGPFAFRNCEDLISISLPDSVTQVGEWAFRGCRKLQKVIVNSPQTVFGDLVFGDCPSALELVVPENSCAKAYAEEENIPYTVLK